MPPRGADTCRAQSRCTRGGASVVTGKGTHTIADNIYEGEFVEDKREVWTERCPTQAHASPRKPTLTTAAGAAPQGHGKLTNVKPNALLLEYEGQWVADRRVGRGRCLYSDGDIEICTFNDPAEGSARPARVGKGVRWIGQGPPAFSKLGDQCARAVSPCSP